MKYVVFTECETWHFISRAERKLRVFEERVLKNVFVRKREQVTEEWKKMHSEELQCV